MRRRHFKFCLVILNLLAFNAYALNAASVLMPHHTAPQTAQAETVDHATVHKGCHEHHKLSAYHQQTSDHCDMPCCKDVSGKTVTQSDHCGCKLGSSTLQLYVVTTNYSDVVINHSMVDAMSTAFILQDRTQRLLRPPIIARHG